MRQAANTNTANHKEPGFSLLELMVVVAILSIVMGAIFTTINDGFKKYRVEEARLNITQQSREFLDQIVRDLHSAGYPSVKMYTPAAIGVVPAAYNNQYVAQGLVAVSSSNIMFEGDVDGSGVVQSIRYTLNADANGNCPCTMLRSAVPKVAGAPTAQATNYNTQLQNVINSLPGGAAYPIAGTTVFGSGQAPVANDALYATYKGVAVFTFFDNAGNTVAVPADLVGANLAAGQAAAANVRIVSIALNMLSPDQDLQTKIRMSVSMRGMVKLNNL